VTINQLVDTAAEVAGKTIHRQHIDGPLGVRGRNSENAFIEKMIGWKPTGKLIDGIRETYRWIEEQNIQHHDPKINILDVLN